MKKRSVLPLFTICAVAATTLLTLSARATLHGSAARSNIAGQSHENSRYPWERRDGDEGDDRRRGSGEFHQVAQLPTGQYITPTALRDSVQQQLNPGLPQYPDFVAGEAVRTQLSPDGTTLAVLTAGQNSLYKTDGTVDTASSTQYIFLYDVAGANRAEPQLTQVLKQTNAHVGLVFSPDGNTLYAAGGNDDAVYVYRKTGSTFIAAAPIALGHIAAGATGAARNKGVGLSVQPNVSGMDISADGATLVVANNYNDSISVIDTATGQVRYEHDLRPFFANNEGRNGGVGGTFPYAVIVKGNDTAFISSDRDREVVVVDIASPAEGHLVARIRLDGNAQRPLPRQSGGAAGAQEAVRRTETSGDYLSAQSRRPIAVR